MHRRRAAVVVVAFGLGSLTACGGGNGSGTDPTEPAQPPIAGSESESAATNGGESPKSGNGALAGKRIVIDPGHNGRNAANPEYINRQVYIGNGRKACDTTGTATVGGYAEYAFTMDVSARLAKLLREQGAKVKLTRLDNNGRGPCIDQRAAIGNDFRADAVVSIHADGAPPEARGFHIIEPKVVPGVNNESVVSKSHKLGLALRDAFKAGTGRPYATYRGTQAMDARDDLGGLNLSKVPKVFIECGNMKNPTEARMFVQPEFREQVAVSLANGFARYFRR